jgi:hypothetical protein
MEKCKNCGNCQHTDHHSGEDEAKRPPAGAADTFPIFTCGNTTKSAPEAE